MYVYRFINSKSEIIYIGKTKELNNRLVNQHAVRGHLPVECYKSVERVEYSKCLNRDDMSIKERYLINKYSPKYNTQYNNQSDFRFEITDFKWETFKEWNFVEPAKRSLRLETEVISGVVHLKRSMGNLELLIENIETPILEINGTYYIIADLPYIPEVQDSSGNCITSDYHKRVYSYREKYYPVARLRFQTINYFFKLDIRKLKD